MTSDFIKSLNSTNAPYGDRRLKSSTTSNTSDIANNSKAPTTAGSSSGTGSPKKTNNLTGQAEMGKEDFLKLLVNQLQQQDPLNPMDSQQFAAQLATFSQLEQLMNINNKLDDLGGNNPTSVSSMASFLGKDVVLKDQAVKLNDGKGPNLTMDFPEGSLSARIDFMDGDGKTVGSYNIENVEAGEQTINLAGVQVPDGSYDIRAVAVNGAGKFIEMNPRISGTVEGFVLEPSPALIVNGEQVAMDEVSEVTTIKTK